MAIVLSLASVKGGVGKTTIAENLAIALGRMGRRVLLIDADIATSALSALLGLTERNPNLHDLLAGRGDPNRAIYDAYGIQVLPSGGTLGGFVRADPVRLARVIDVYKNNYDFLIIDTPPGITKYSLAPLKISDSILSVTTQDPSAIEAAVKLEEACAAMQLKLTGVVVNRVRKPSFFKKLKLYSRAQNQSRLRTPILLGIPEDLMVMEAATMRRPMLFYKPKSAVSKAIWELARKIGG